MSKGGAEMEPSISDQRQADINRDTHTRREIYRYSNGGRGENLLE
jgi:hypothetical protein